MGIMVTQRPSDMERFVNRKVRMQIERGFTNPFLGSASRRVEASEWLERWDVAHYGGAERPPMLCCCNSAQVELLVQFG
jgi:hypothetical protein